MEDILDDPLEEEGNALKVRPGFVTGYLVLMIIFNAYNAINSFIFIVSFNGPEIYGLPKLKLYLFMMGIAGVLNIVFSIMLLNWKRNGFYGFLGSALLIIGANIYLSAGIAQLLVGLFGILILYVILHIKKDGKDTWEQLE